MKNRKNLFVFLLILILTMILTTQLQADDSLNVTLLGQYDNKVIYDIKSSGDYAYIASGTRDIVKSCVQKNVSSIST